MLAILPVPTVRPLGGAKESIAASQAWFLFCGRPYILMLYYIHIHPCNQQQQLTPKCSSPPSSYLLKRHLQSTKPCCFCLWSDHEVASDGLAELPLVASG